MPTGSGKSLTYQLAAMLRPEPTLVLSPLIALMKDQVDKLPPSDRSDCDVRQFVAAGRGDRARGSPSVAAGEKRLVYAAPERLRQAGFLDTLRSIGIGLVVVDEVHCVSMWGHDFRPDYLFIRRALAELGEPTLLGMTATATPETARESAKRSAGGRRSCTRRRPAEPALRRPDRRECGGPDAGPRRQDRPTRGRRGDRLRAFASFHGGARPRCRGHGFRAAHYHAGLEPDERTRVQDEFVTGRTPTVVATTAFGMGIDKPDVRLVCLVNHPSSLEEYVQMVGRAGRDGEPSDTLLLASPADGASLRRFALGDVPAASELRVVYRALRAARGPVNPDELAALVPDRDPRVLVGMLEQAGLVRRGLDEGRRMRVDVPAAPEDAAHRVDELLDRARVVAEARADRIISFADSARCRHAQVAAHFGETFEPPCGACDVCVPRPQPFSIPADIVSPLPEDVGDAIVETVSRLRWPLGRQSLSRCCAARSRHLGRRAIHPPSASSARPATPTFDAGSRSSRGSGALVETTTADGYRVLEADPGVTPPAIRVGATHGRRRGALRASPQLADRPRTGRQRARLRRVPRHDASRARRCTAALAG